MEAIIIILFWYKTKYKGENRLTSSAIIELSKVNWNKLGKIYLSYKNNNLGKN